MENNTSDGKTQINKTRDQDVKEKVVYTLVPEIEAPSQESIPAIESKPVYNQTSFATYGSNQYSSRPRYPGKFSGQKTYQPKPFFALNTLTGIRRQIEYYFSDENLVKDKFFKSKMDKNGYVNVNVISAFPRMKNGNITKDIILNAGKRSKKIQVYGNFMRSKFSWHKFIESPMTQNPEETMESLKPEELSEEEFIILKEKSENEPVSEESDEENHQENIFKENQKLYGNNNVQQATYENYFYEKNIAPVYANNGLDGIYSPYVYGNSQVQSSMLYRGLYVQGNNFGNRGYSARRSGYRGRRGRYGRRSSEKKKRNSGKKNSFDSDRKINQKSQQNPSANNSKREEFKEKAVEERLEGTVSEVTEKLKNTQISQDGSAITNAVRDSQ